MTKKALILVLVMVGIVYASGPQFKLGEHGVWNPDVELAELEAMIASAKESGKAIDPAWELRVRDLVSLVKNHPANQNVKGLSAIEFRSLEQDGFGTPVVIRPQELTPLEQQIQTLEQQLLNGLGEQVDDVTFLSVKEQLNELYVQRPENQIRRNPLDQGAATCPGTVVTGVPYTDSGTTVGMGNEYAEDSSATCVNFSNAPEVVYAFTPSSSQTYTVNTEGSSYDTYLYITTGGGCPGNTHVACDDDNGTGVLSSISVFMLAGQTYFIFVDGYNTSSGNYVLNILGNCSIECQPTDVLECAGEFQGPGNETTDCNGGCDNTFFGGVESWQEISPYQTICGRGFTYLADAGNSRRDVDGYRLTLTEACSLSVTVRAEFPCQVYVTSGSCPWNIPYASPAWTYACSTVTFVTQCFQPGTYSVLILPSVFTGLNSPQEYRARVDLIPCSGCRIDAFLQAPGSGGWHTCGAGNNNSLRPSEDYTYRVNIPHDGDWTFTTCNDDSIWDSYIYLSTQCNGGVIAEDDDGCGGIGLSVINCVSLTAGDYYLTVEGWSSLRCGPFNLRVFECIGSCCYGDPGSENCAYVSPSFCDSIGGAWTFMEPCSTGACYTRPDCGDGNATFSQLPSLPDESWNAFRSDYNLNRLLYDNYSVPGPIGSIKFWGVFVDDATLPCFNATEDFEITFIDSVNNVQQVYNVTLTPTVLDPLYFGLYNLSEFEATLNPACEITTGYVRVAGVGSPNCDFFWSWPISGDGMPSYETNGAGGGAFQNSFELAFCLDEAPCEVDSVTIISISPSTARVDWWQNQSGPVNFWYTTDPNAEYPVGFIDAGPPPGAPQTGGHHFVDVNGTFDFLKIVLILTCDAQAPAAVNQPSPLFNRQIR